jgi:hypothetical protein
MFSHEICFLNVKVLLNCFSLVYSHFQSLLIPVMPSSPESEGPTPSKRKNYGLKFKLEAVEYAEEHNKMKAAKKFGVTRSRIQEWTKQKAELLTQK